MATTTFTNVDNLVNELTTNEVGQTLYWEKFFTQSHAVANLGYSSWFTGSSPVSGSLPTSGPSNGRVCTVTTSGAIGYVNAAGGTTNIVSYIGLYANNPGTFILVDRISDVKLAGGDSGTITGVDATSRLAASTGAQILFEAATDANQNTGAVSPTITYTNQAGVSHTTPAFTPRNATNNITGETLPAVFVPLAANDTGARTITSFSASLSHSFCVSLVRTIATIIVPVANRWVDRDLIFDQNQQPILYDSSCLMWLFLPFGSATSCSAYGIIRVVAN